MLDYIISIPRPSSTVRWMNPRNSSSRICPVNRTSTSKSRLWRGRKSAREGRACLHRLPRRWTRQPNTQLEEEEIPPAKVGLNLFSSILLYVYNIALSTTTYPSPTIRKFFHVILYVLVSLTTPPSLHKAFHLSKSNINSKIWSDSDWGGGQRWRGILPLGC